MKSSELLPARLLFRDGPVSMTFSLGIVLALTLTLSSAIRAQTDPEEVDSEEPGVEERLEEFNVKWSDRVLRAADSIDSYFGDERITDEAQRTRIKVRLDIELEEGEGMDLGGSVSAKIHLPRVEERLSLVLNDIENEDDFLTQDEDQEEDRSLALRFDWFNTLKRTLSFDIGIRRPDDKYELYGRVRNRKTWEHTRWINRLDNKLYYYTDFGVEYDGKLDFDRVLPPRLLFRYRTRLRWWEDDDKCNDAWCPEQHFILYQRMKSPRHAIAWEWSTFFQTDPDDGSDDYVDLTRLRMRYRHDTPWDWLFVELQPTINFDREDDYDGDLAFLVRLEGIFGYQPQYESLDFGPEQALDKVPGEN